MRKDQPQEYVILGFLMTQERHGYEIHQYLESGLGPIWYAGRSQVYALLKRLEAADEVFSKLKQQNLRPAKKIYSITDKGRKTFQDWLQKPVEKIRDLRIEFLAKLFFIKELRLAGMPELIEKQIQICQEQLESLRKQDETVADEFRRLVLSFRIGQINAILAWLRECLQAFHATPEKGKPEDERISS
jgi:DNA-binding PadR family transcriptional regulator